MALNHNQQIESGNLAAKTVKGSAYSITASAATLVLGLGRSILMARLLAPEDFGLVAFAMVFLNFTTPLRNFGLDLALIHRKPDAETSLDEALAVHFSLRLILTGLFVLFILATTPLLRYFYPQKHLLVPVLLALTVGEIARALSATPTTYLRKEMRFKELAVLQVLTSLTMTIVGPWMAWQNWGIWSIVGERISGVMVATFVVWVFIRPWQARWKLKWGLVKWYWEYGRFVFTSRLLSPVIEQFDDFWVGASLGSQSLGFYSRAYEFAQYPRRSVSDPIVSVLFATFAKVQDDRLRLSKAYFRVASLVIRVGFLLAGTLVLAANEFVSLFLGVKWVPMVFTFQIMVVYTLLYPLLSVSGYLAAACGHPEFNTRVRVAQTIYFVPAVIFASRLWGINGVAAATNMMLLIGLALSLHQIRKLVDISLWRMLAVPTLALLVAGLASWQLSTLASDSTLIQLFFKASIYVAGYSLVSLFFEQEEYFVQLRTLFGLLLRKRSDDA